MKRNLWFNCGISPVLIHAFFVYMQLLQNREHTNHYFMIYILITSVSWKSLLSLRQIE